MKKERRRRIRRKWKEGWRRNGGRIERGSRKGENEIVREEGKKRGRRGNRHSFLV